MQTKVIIKGMKCDGCATTVLMHLQAIDGVTGVEMSLNNNLCIICSEREISEKQFCESLEDTPFDVIAIKTA